MTASTLEEFKSLNTLCGLVCAKPKVRFCGVINSMGRLIAGSFRDSIQPLDNDQQRQMLYMQSKLELSMKGEFDDSLGRVNYIVTYHDNVVIINVPSENQQYHVLISAERIANVTKVVGYVIGLFRKYDVFSNKYTRQHDKMIEKTIHS